MAFKRTAIKTFAVANDVYAGASVTYYTVDAAGVKTTTKAALYAATTGTSELANPQTLDGYGKFAAPVYHDVAIVGVVGTTLIANHDTGVIYPAVTGVTLRATAGDPSTWTAGDIIINSVDNNVKIAADGALRTVITW